MVPLLQSLRKARKYHGIAMEKFYRYAGISRQGFFSALSRRSENRSQWEDISRLVKEYRENKDCRAGSRSLHRNLGIKSKFGIGVSKFEQVMSEKGLSLMPLRTRVVTTRSSMQSWNYPNLVNGLSVRGISEVVVGDLSYVSIGRHRYFLFCLTDVYSARIVGYHLGSRMRAEEAKKALDMWAGLRGEKNLKGCIHHTDGGSQYFSSLYLGGLERMGIRVSCAENCLMNGYAEQRNGLLKHHLLPTIKYTQGKELNGEMKRVMRFYNHERRQQALGWQSPVEFETEISTIKDRPTKVLYKFEET
jgi:transposase InsO family protein